MKWVIIFLLFASIAIQAQGNAQSFALNTTGKSKLSGFRNCPWGSTIGKVKKTEKGKLVETLKYDDGVNYLAFDGNVSGISTSILYGFVDDKLVRGAYVISEEHTNKNKYIDDYYKIQSGLIQKYGPPESDDRKWNDDLYQSDPSAWGLAVSIGHLKYQSVWKFTNGDILLTLTGDNYKISLLVDYTNDAFAKFNNQSQQKINDSEF